MRQPVSTISNVAYLIPAILAPTPLSSLAFILLAVGSGLFHCLPTYEDWARHMDEIGMYAVFWALIGVMVGDPASYVCMVGFVGMSIGYKHFDSFQSIPILFVCLLAVKVSEAGAIALYVLIPFGAALAATALADRYPTDAVMHDVAHGSWHLLTATGLTLFLII